MGKCVDALIVCVNFSDYLSYTLPLNLPELRSITVATTHNDLDTIELCKSYPQVRVVALTPQPVYNKGKILNAILPLFSEWVLLLDADIILPRGFSHNLPELQPLTIYGIHRRHCITYELWVKGESSSLYELPVPLGFFQLFNRRHFSQRYSEREGGGEDVESLQHFPNRVILDQEVMHLGRVGKNWRGRKTPRWH
jgi:hypothetical protein